MSADNGILISRCQVFLIISLFALFPCSIQANNWDSTEKNLFISSTALSFMDCMQTRHIYDSNEYDELNPIIENGVDKFGKGFVPIYFATSVVMKYMIADWLRPKHRKAFLGSMVVLQIGIVGRNFRLGIGVEF